MYMVPIHKKLAKTTTRTHQNTVRSAVATHVHHTAVHHSISIITYTTTGGILIPCCVLQNSLSSSHGFYSHENLIKLLS